MLMSNARDHVVALASLSLPLHCTFRPPIRSSSQSWREILTSCTLCSMYCILCIKHFFYSHGNMLCPKLIGECVPFKRGELKTTLIFFPRARVLILSFSPTSSSLQALLVRASLCVAGLGRWVLERIGRQCSQNATVCDGKTFAQMMSLQIGMQVDVSFLAGGTECDWYWSSFVAKELRKWIECSSERGINR